MKAKKLSLLLLLLPALVAFMSLPAFAGYGTPVITAQGRLQYATDLLTFMKKIDSQIPSLSPSQEDWLNKELSEYEKTKDIRRYFEITTTKEFTINFVKSHLAGMIYTLNKIISTPSTDEKKEMYYWSIVADSLLSYEFWTDIIILIKDFKVIDSKLFNSFSEADTDKSRVMCMFFLNNGVLPARQILKKIIAAYQEQSEH